MNKTGLIAAFLTLLVSWATSLITLFSQPNIRDFTDIAPVSYAVACLGAIVAASQTYKARMKGTPDE
jgi:hypothetical protein